MQRSKSFSAILATCLCAMAFALAQPILELLRRNPEILTVHALEGGRLLGFALGLAIVPALALGAIVWVAHRLRPGWEHAPLGIAVGLCVALTLLAPLVRAALPSGVSLAAASVLGVGSFLLFLRSGAFRLGLRWGWLCMPLFLAIFALQPPVRPLWFAGAEARNSGASTVARPVPIVFAIFDALPLASLLDADGDVDAELYPNFHALSRDAIWFRNHTTSAERTLKSLPAMLTGCRPNGDAQPVLREYPRNLFTLLERSHQLHVYEPITRLAPESAFNESSVRTLVQDLSVLYAHLILPANLRSSLPPIDKSWRGFGWGQAGRGADSHRMARGWRDFVQDIRQEGRPSLHFVHTILPHAPFLFTESGQRYSRTGMEPSGQGDYTGIRDEDEWAAIHSYQRHLLQLGFVDRLLGELLGALKRESLYDEAIVVVTADHGVSFRRGVSGRLAGARNLPDILAVPLFVKLPHNERAGERVLRGTESIDIFPTLVELLEAETDWQLDGSSLLNPQLDRSTKTSLGHRGVIQASAQEASDLTETLTEKLQWFRHGLYAPGPHGALVGRTIADFEPSPAPSRFGANILRPGNSLLVEADALLPAEVVGILTAPDLRATAPHLALAVDGVIRTVTHPYEARRGAKNSAWSALLPEAALSDGRHELQLFAIDETADGVRLAALGEAGELPSFQGTRLGPQLVFGVEEAGFRRHKPHQSEDYRWTDPTASFDIPLRENERPNSLRIRIAHAAPEGSELVLLVDGNEIFSGTVPDGGWEAEYSLENLRLSESVRVELRCSAFARHFNATEMPSGQDVGVALQGLWLQRRRVR